MRSHFLFCLILLLLSHTRHRVLCNEGEREKWYEASAKLDDVVWPLKSRFVSLVDSVTSNYSIILTDSCRKSLTDFSKGLVTGSRESYVLFDSFTKTHPGFIGQRIYDFGAYEQCLNAQFNGSIARYVLLQLAIPVPANKKEIKYNDQQDSWIAEFSNKIPAVRTSHMPIAICIPYQCSEEDLKHVIESDIVKSLVLPSRLLVDSTESLDDDLEPDRKWLQIISRIVILGIIGAVAVSTILNHFIPGCNVLTSFDATANTVKLLSDGKEENKNLSFMNGIRAFYLIFNIPSHIAIPHVEATFLYNFPIFLNANKFSEVSKMYTMTAPHYVSSNVLMAATLSTIGWLPELSKGSKIGLMGYVLLRALRTLPVMMAYILITFTFPLVGPGGGPVMTRMQQMLSNKCYQHGWKDMLFISNYGTFHEMCMPVGWFMSADFQLYVLAFIYLGFLNTRPRLGFSLIALQITAGIFIHAWYLDAVDVPSLLKLWTWDGYNNLHNYIKLFAHTFNYIAVYPIGVILGYLMVNGYRIDTKNRGEAFIALFAVTQISLFSPAFLYNDQEFKYGGRTGEIIFGCLHRVVFVSCYSGICLLLHGHPDFVVSRLLSARWLTVVSRFSYSAFMAHPLVIMFTLSSLPDLYMSSTFLTMMCLYTLIVSLIAGYLFFLLFEAPAMNLLKSWATSRIRKSSREDKHLVQNNNNRLHQE